MKYYVYVGYYENFITGHKLPKPYELEKQFNDLEDAIEYVIGEYDDDSLFYTDDVIDEAIELGYVPNDEDWKDFLMEESKELASKSIKERKATVGEYVFNNKEYDYYSIRDKKSNSECFWGNENNVLNSDYVLFTIINSDVDEESGDKILYIDLKENAWVESKKSSSKSIKERKI